jgi:hypothetical protein
MFRAICLAIALAALAYPANAQTPSTGTVAGGGTPEHQEDQSGKGFDTKAAPTVKVQKSKATVQDKVHQARRQQAKQDKAKAQKFPAKGKPVPAPKH